MADFITIVMPALNEEAHIRAAIFSILPSSRQYELELLVVDGGSTDGTCRMIAELAEDDPRIKLLANRDRLQSAGINLAVRLADRRSKIFIRADCHAIYPAKFIETVTAPLREGRASSVVVGMRTEGKTFVQRAIAIAQNSRLGNGGAAHRHRTASGYVDHGHHAAFSIDAFRDTGGYRTTMPANEDAELDMRLTKSGHRIWLCREAEITYFPREHFSDLARQYFRYGAGRATTCLIHKKRPKLRQVIPLLILLGTGTSSFAAFSNSAALLFPLCYAGACQVYAAFLAFRHRDSAALLSGLAAIIMHLSWGAGFIFGILKRDYSTEGSSAADISKRR